MILNNLRISVIGLSQGIVVGTAFAAFISILDLLYRLLQLSSTSNYLKLYQNSLILPFSLFSFLSLVDIKLSLGYISVIYIGLFMGIFIGLFASALAEVLNVIPVIANKLYVNKYINYIIVSMIAGKVIGSLIYWLKINK